jgi:hypothetical protein
VSVSPVVIFPFGSVSVCLVQGLSTATPVLVLEDGTELPAVYEQSMGTNMVFAARQEQQYRLIAKTNTILRVDRPVTKPIISKGPGQTVDAASNAVPTSQGDAVFAAQENAEHEQEIAVAEQQAS